MFDHPSFDQHERVVFAHDAPTGATAQDGARLHAAGVLYAPDYVIDAGGIISVGRENPGGATNESITAKIYRIPARLTEFFARSSATDRPTSELADERARQLLLEA